MKRSNPQLKTVRILMYGALLPAVGVVLTLAACNSVGPTPAPQPTPQPTPVGQVCSGIVAEDGANSVFVAGGFGNDSAAGTSDAPLASIQAAIDLAEQFGGGDVHVAGGVYTETVTLRSSVRLYGGYDRATWQQCPQTSTTTIVGGATAMTGKDVTGVVVNGFSIVSSDASGGGSSVAVRLIDASNVELSDNRIVAGNGSDGADGAAGAQGANGANGSAGTNAKACPPAVTGGSGGSSSFGASGGKGGTGGAAGGFDGSSGGGPFGGAGGAGGGLGTSGDEGERGNFDDLAASGAPGLGGAEIGSMTNGSYTPANGDAGDNGENGSGGGGGGGGGGALVFACGAGGGGGGAGGAGGKGGKGGAGGGGSFGVLLINAVDVVLENNVIETAGGGNGGAGGAEGAGGLGGAGGAGGNRFGGQGPGRDGGDGGDGGPGGAGGGGGGGPSIGIYEDADSIATLTRNRTLLGEPGLGGRSPGGTDGETGVSGAHVKIDASGDVQVLTQI